MQGRKITTFFFSHFPYSYGEYDMWKVFQRWGRVTEVFISRRLDKWGHRYGFVRFLEVKNEQNLQRELDSIRIGSTKLHVNKPRYEREDWKKTDKQTNNLVGNRAPRTRKVWREVRHQQSYAQAVKASSNTSQLKWKGISFDTEEADTKWLEGSYIGRVSNYSNVHMVMEEAIQHGRGRLNAKYLGENALLIQGIEGAELGNLMGENKEWWEDNFESIVPWNPSQIVQNKLVWVRCMGLPFNLWSQQCFSKIVAPFGALVSVDEKTLTWERLEFARLKVKAPFGSKIWVQKGMKINGQIYSVVLEEETTHETLSFCCCANDNNFSSDNNISRNGLDDFSSVSERCENDIFSDWEKEVMEEDRTIQSPVARGNRSFRATSEMSSGIGNVSILDRCGTKAENRTSAPMMDAAQPVAELVNKNSLKGTNPSDRKFISSNHATFNNGPKSKEAQSVEEGCTVSIVKETMLGPNMNVSPANVCTATLPMVLINSQNKLSQNECHPEHEGLEIENQSTRLADHNQEQGGHYTSEIGQHSIEPNVTPLKRSSFSNAIVMSSAGPSPSGDQVRCGNHMTKQMTLINESIMDPRDFQERRQFWIGESSKKQPTIKKRSVKENGRATKRKLIRSVVQSICNSLPDENILNCNRLFWSTKSPLGDSESVKIWSLAKELGVTFSGEEEQILKELESMEKRDRNRGKRKVGKNIVVNENH